MSEPLNPVLYRQLLALYDGHVRIIKPGEEAVITTEFDARESRNVTKVYGGEQYVVPCNFCGDHSAHGHLYIHYRYGVLRDDDDDNSANYHLATCFRRNCLADPDNRRLLRDNLTGHFFNDRQKFARAKLRPGQTLCTTPGKLSEASLPGIVIDLDKLPEGHEVRNYLVRRGFDIKELVKDRGVGVCATCIKAPIMEGRIYIPFYMDGVLVGWQGRYPADVNWKQKRTLKYYNMKGITKSLMLYGYDLAKAHQTVVICEGVTDVWKIGPQGVALLGKTMSATQANLVVNTWGKGVIIILLDSNDPDAVKAAARIEHQLRPRISGQIYNLRLPPGCDPGMVERECIWTYLNTEMEAQAPEACESEKLEPAVG